MKISITFIVFMLLANQLIVSCKKNDYENDDLRAQILLMNGNIPNYSYSGYKMSAEPIPNVPIARVVTPIIGDNSKQIQDIIDSLGNTPMDEKGIRGAILLKAGVYELAESIKINKSGIVLRGEGQGPQGTILFDTRAPNSINRTYLKTITTIEVHGGTVAFRHTSQPYGITEDVYVGGTKIIVQNASSFNVGDTIMVTKTPNQDWISKIEMGVHNWTTGAFNIRHPRIVTAVNADTLAINIPMVDDIKSAYGGGHVTLASLPDRVENVGIENLRVQSYAAHEEDEKHAWNGITLHNVQHSWVRNVTATGYAFSTVWLVNANNCTIQDCAGIEFKSQILGDRRSAFIIGRQSSFNLFQRCYVEGSRHDFTTAEQVPGPNVFLDCLGVNSYSDTGPHGRWASGTLFDNVKSSMIYARNAGDSGASQGWTGVYQMFWNNIATKGFLVQSPPLGENWIVGSQGMIYNASTIQVISRGMHVSPRSLFLKQLSDRTGPTSLMTSSSITNRIFAAEQLNSSNTVWDKLEKWAGNDNAVVSPNYNTF